jgi:hypothetical protein
MVDSHRQFIPFWLSLSRTATIERPQRDGVSPISGERHSVDKTEASGDSLQRILKMTCRWSVRPQEAASSAAESATLRSAFRLQIDELWRAFLQRGEQRGTFRLIGSGGSVRGLSTAERKCPASRAAPAPGRVSPRAAEMRRDTSPHSNFTIASRVLETLGPRAPENTSIW